MDDNYDKDEIYNDEIIPLLDKIINICKEHKIPMLASFQTAVANGGLSYTTRDTTQLFPEDRIVGNAIMKMALVGEESRLLSDQVITNGGTA